MSDDWNAGDLALCILDCWSPPDRSPNEVPAIYASLAPRKGSQWRVLHVELHFRAEEGREVPYLSLEGQPANAVFHPSYFRKVNPPAPNEIERQAERPRVAA